MNHQLKRSVAFTNETERGFGYSDFIYNSLNSNKQENIIQQISYKEMNNQKIYCTSISIHLLQKIHTIPKIKKRVC